ncbi:sperm microtubule inner protein 11 isoform X1 [Leuresthes tenuis]|uniref:sperm microtubule inner protein 11 isoform X1 n=1 Tax=Leuresthes tenuis TaxID=355514 RepID=UPI003B501925
MAFFGLTHLGYQNPIGDKLIANPRGASLPQDANVRAALPPSLQRHQEPLRCADVSKVHHQPLPYSTDIHHGSYKRYREMVILAQAPRSPNQLYTMPLTDNQQYGWMVSKMPEPWAQVRRFPRKNSEMSKFVNDMSMTDREFSLF